MLSRDLKYSPRELGSEDDAVRGGGFHIDQMYSTACSLLGKVLKAAPKLLTIGTVFRVLKEPM